MIQKPYSINLSGMTVDAMESNMIKWRVSGSVQSRYSIYVSFNNNTDIRLNAHGLTTDDLIVNMNRDATHLGIREIEIIDSNHIKVDTITNMQVGDEINKYLLNDTLDLRVGMDSTVNKIYVPSLDGLNVGDIVEIEGSYRFINSLLTETIETVDVYSINFLDSLPTIPSVDNAITLYSFSETVTSEYEFKVENRDSYVTEHNLQIGSVLNGREYKLLITVFDESGNSATSEQIIFQTSSRPVISVNMIGDNGVINNSSYNFTAVYTQNEGESLKSYVVILYNSNLSPLSKSDIKTALPLTQMFYDLKSGNKYYVEFQATSVKGLTGSSGLIEFSVSYSTPTINTTLIAKNVENAGIELNWKTVQILGSSTGNITFPNESEVDARNGIVFFDEGFSIDENNFTFKLWVREPKHKENLIKLHANGTGNYFALQYHILDERFHLYKVVNGITTEWTSESVSGTNFYVYIQQVQSDCNIHAEVIE